MNAIGNPESEGKNRLLQEFPSHSYDEWKSAAEALLKGRSFEKTLVTPTYEGFSLEPIYMSKDLEGIGHLGGNPGQGNMGRGSRLEGYLTEGWLVSQELGAATPEELNKQILEGLANGQNELNLWLDAPSRNGLDADNSEVGKAGVCGVSMNTQSDLAAVLENVHLEAISTYLRSGQSALAAYGYLLNVAESKGLDLSALKGCIDFDPLGHLVATGQLSGGLEASLDQMAELVKYASEVTPGIQVLDIQGHSYHNGGGSSSQELGAVLATAQYYFDGLMKRGLSAETIAKSIRISLSIGPDYFIEIAKLRAMRILWSQFLEAYGVEESLRVVHIHARTGLWNKTVLDPYVNMLRTTTEAFSAVVGGCDSLHVGHFDEVIRESDTFSRRIARNTHPILSEECGMTQVLDPSGGSWAVEKLTDQMGQKGWEQFQLILENGGMLEALKSGFWQKEIEAVLAKKRKAIQQRRAVIVGNNNYPNPSEELLSCEPADLEGILAGSRARLAGVRESRDSGVYESAIQAITDSKGSGLIESVRKAAAAGASITEIAQALPAGEGEAVDAIKLSRAAAEYESLRQTATAMAGSGKPAVVHQLNLGPSRKYRIRADWTSAFFQVAGISVLNDEDYDTPELALEALKKSGASVAIITSDDDTYAANAESLASTISTELPEVKVLLAGAPGDAEAAFKAAGVSDFVHVRVNNYIFNRDLLATMGSEN